MIRKKPVFIRFLLVVLGLLILFTLPVIAQPRVTFRFNLTPNVYISIPRSPSVNISVDRGEDSTYFIGDPITIRYGASNAGYINIFDYTPDGGVIILVRDQRISAGSNLVLNSTVSGPAGVERLVILYTPKPVGENQIQGFIESPHQSGRQFPLSAVNRTHFNVAARTRSTTLTLEPSSFTLEPGSSYTMTAQLTDVNGRPLRGANLSWSTDNGSLSSYNTITDSNGRSSVDYYAPNTTRPSTAVINVNFSGGGGASPSFAQSTVNIISRTRPTEILINPTSFSARPGDEVLLTATLRDLNGNPINGRTIYWTSSLGSFNKSSVATDSSGRATVIYYASEVNDVTTVSITAEFRGATGLGSTTTTISGVIEPIFPVTPTNTLYYFDFGNGAAEHNFLTMRYTGNLVNGYSLSNTYSLEILSGNNIDLTFSPGSIPEKASLFIWAQGDSGARVRVTFNNRNPLNINLDSGLIEPDNPKIINIPIQNLIEGNNRLRIEGDVGRRRPIHIQRVMIVF
ncbi:MAG: DUF4384 domain-containing protein [Candidatus Atribacteria bacterium]|nr:DUF4384 domain-containing protein [Candidatus Atribacteria bacterium]